MTVATKTRPTMRNDSESTHDSSRRARGSEKIRTAMTRSSRVVAIRRKPVTHTSISRRSAERSGPSRTGLLFDGASNAEDRQIHRDQKSANHSAQKHHHYRLDHRGQTGDRCVYLVIVEVGDLVEHGVHCA